MLDLDRRIGSGKAASEGNPDAKITKMKDGRTHLAHKAEHAVDLETGREPLHRLDRIMTPEQIAEAEERAAQLVK